MAYASGDTITGAQYNIFVNNSSSPFGYNHFAGTGSGVDGLGQTHIATVSANATTTTTTYGTSASRWIHQSTIRRVVRCGARPTH